MITRFYDLLLRASHYCDDHKMLIFFIPFLIYMSNGREISSGDPTPTVFIAVQIVKQGTVFLDDLHDYIPYHSLPYYVSEQKGHIVSNYPVYPGIMASPLFAPFVWIGMIEKNEGDLVWKYLSKLSGAVFTALSVLIFYLALKLLIGAQGALVLSMAYGLGTALWPVASQSLWQHGPSVFWWSVCFYSLIRASLETSKKRTLFFLILCGFAGGSVVLCRTVNVIGLAGVSLGVLWRFRQYTVFFLVPAVLLSLILFAYNIAIFDSWKGGDSVLHRLHWELDRIEGGSWSTPLWIGLPGQLISPSRGIFIFSPFLLFAFWGMYEIWKKNDPVWRMLALTIPAPLLMYVVFGKYAVWWGGNSHYGPRYQIETYPFLLLYLAAVWPMITGSKRLSIAFFATLIYACFVQWIGSFCYPGGWETQPVSLSEDYSRLWNWTYNQIFVSLKNGIHCPFS